MRFFATLIFSLSLAYAADHEVIVKLDRLQDPTIAFSTLTITSWRQLGNGPVYRLNVTTNLTKSQLIDELYRKTSVQYAEPNQKTSLDTLEAAVNLDSRVIFIIDDIDDEAIYTSTQQGIINSRVIFIIDETEMEFAPLYGQYHMTEVNAYKAWEYATGAGQTVAVLDTGVDVDHPFLVRNLVPGFDFVDNDSNPDEPRANLDTNKNGKLDEGYGHGTHVAGIVKTIAPNAPIMPIRVVNSDGQADLANIISGIEWAIDHGARVINMSMSISEPSQLLMDAINQARQAGIVVITSAGNENSEQLQFPATETEVVSVASVGPTLARSTFSNYGRRVDVAAPGERIISAMPGGTYVARSGTSMSSPIVAAEAAIIFELVPTSSISYLTHRITNKVKPLATSTQLKGMADVWDAITVQNQN
jgi:subtilisin family serine protease